MVKIKIIFLFILVSVFCNAQNTTTIPISINSWHSYHVPSDSTVLEKYSHDNSRWTVYKQNDSIYVIDTYDPYLREQVPADSLPASVSSALWKNEKIRYHRGKGIMAVDDGYLIGINKGEYGAYIVWYSKNGKKHYLVSFDQVVQFIRKDGEVFAIQGLAHLQSSNGSLIRFYKLGKKWTVDTYHTLPYAPVGIGINSKNHFVIATSRSLLEINEIERYTTLMDQAFWESISYLYPNSLVIQNDIVYIGMRKGVFKFDLKNKKQEWLMKD